MRYQLVAATLAIGLASPAFAQSHTLPAGSEYAAQPPIDWTVGGARSLNAAGGLYEGRSVAVDPQADASRLEDGSGDLE